MRAGLVVMVTGILGYAAAHMGFLPREDTAFLFVPLILMGAGRIVRKGAADAE